VAFPAELPRGCRSWVNRGSGAGARHAYAVLLSLRNAARWARVSTETGARWSHGRSVPAESGASSPVLHRGDLSHPGEKTESPLETENLLLESFACLGEQCYFWPLIPHHKPSKAKGKRRHLCSALLEERRAGWSLQMVCRPSPAAHGDSRRSRQCSQRPSPWPASAPQQPPWLVLPRTAFANTVVVSKMTLGDLRQLGTTKVKPELPTSEPWYPLLLAELWQNGRVAGPPPRLGPKATRGTCGTSLGSNKRRRQFRIFTSKK